MADLPVNRSRHRVLGTLLVLAGCGGSSSDGPAAPPTPSEAAGDFGDSTHQAAVAAPVDQQEYRLLILQPEKRRPG